VVSIRPTEWARHVLCFLPPRLVRDADGVYARSGRAASQPLLLAPGGARRGAANLWTEWTAAIGFAPGPTTSSVTHESVTRPLPQVEAEGVGGRSTRPNSSSLLMLLHLRHLRACVQRACVQTARRARRRGAVRRSQRVCKSSGARPHNRSFWQWPERAGARQTSKGICARRSGSRPRWPPRPPRCNFRHTL